VEKLGARIFQQLKHNIFIDAIFNVGQKTDQGIGMVEGQYTEDVDFANEPVVTSSPEIPCMIKFPENNEIKELCGFIGTYIYMFCKLNTFIAMLKI